MYYYKFIDIKYHHNIYDIYCCRLKSKTRRNNNHYNLNGNHYIKGGFSYKLMHYLKFS